MVGAPSTCTDLGPPLKMMPLGLRASISATGMSRGTISEYTCASRTRRAISCAYWAPKSTTRTVSKGSEVGGAAPRVAASGGLGGGGKWAADRGGIGAAGECRGRVGAGGHAPVGDHLHAAGGRVEMAHAGPGGVGAGRGLRKADAEDGPRGA